MTDPSGIRSAALGAVKWNAVGQAGRQGMSFLVSITLARLIAPAEFGLLAMLYVFQEIANALVNSGLNAPLVQARSVSGEDCSTVFLFNIGMAFLCYGLLLAGAPWIAHFYGEPRLEGLVALFGMVFLIHAFGNVQQALLLRALNYRDMNLIPLVAVAAASVVAVSMAFAGFGVYSLLGQHITYAVVANSLFWFRSAWHPSLTFSRATLRNYLGLGSTVFLTSLLDKLLATLDDLVVGKLRGTAFLGQYNRGKSTRDLPVNHIGSVLASLVFPVFSRIHDPAELRFQLGRFIGMVTYLTAPIMVGIILVAEPLTVVLYSETWRPAARFLQLFCLFGLAIPLNSILVQTIMSRGAHRHLLKLELAKKSFLLGCLAVGAVAGDPVGLILALALGHYVALGASFIAVSRLLETSPGSLAAHALPGVLMSLAMAIPAFAARHVADSGDLQQLMVTTLVGAGSYWLMSAMTRSRDYLSAKGMLLSVLPGSGPRVSP